MDNNHFVEILKTLELAHVAVTATIDASGRLGTVGGLWPKLLAASQEAAGLGVVRLIVVAEGQTDVPRELLALDAAPLRVIQAATLQEAVQRLYEEYGTRDAVRRYERAQCMHLDVMGRSVPLESHYQVLPLLRALKRERLPRAGREKPEKTEVQEDTLSGLRTEEILRWEEEVQQEDITYERVSLIEIFQRFRSVITAAKSDVPRFVALGPPGCGKTTFLQYLGWQAANGTLVISEHALLPTRVRLREWETWTTEHAGEQILPQYLADRCKYLSPAPHATQWQQWLERGEVLLLLDGLDEIEGKPLFTQALSAALTTFRSCPIVLTCRTVSFEQHKALCAEFPLFTLAGFDHERRNAYIHTFPAEHPNVYNPGRVIHQLNRTPHIWSLAANPLLLSILCYVVDASSGEHFPATRGELYRRALEVLLARRSRRLEVHYPGEEPDTDEKLTILQQTALSLLMRGERSLMFSGQDLGQALKHALREEGYGDAPAPWANALRTDLMQNSGILRGNSDHGFFFLHLTMQEYLTAAAIAKRINEKGWEASARQIPN